MEGKVTSLVRPRHEWSELQRRSLRAQALADLRALSRDESQPNPSAHGPAVVGPP